MPVINPTTPGPGVPPGAAGGCVWPVDTVCLPGWPANPADWTPQHVLAVEIATDMLWRRTAGRYGLCPELVRPCRRPCTPDQHGTPPLWDALPGRPDLIGRWIEAGCSCRTEGCSCRPPCSVRLPGPVNAVLEVRVDGQVLADTEYTLRHTPTRDGSLLRRGGAEGPCWPVCQNLEREITEPGTFSVLYLRGRPVPAAGMRAMAALAAEVHKQCTGAPCRLPDRVRTVTREGLTYDMFDPGEWLDEGLTGLREVDSWLRSVNPHGLTQPSAVFSLDLEGPPSATRWSDR